MMEGRKKTNKKSKNEKWEEQKQGQIKKNERRGKTNEMRG